jgi:hypothetical protein
MLALYHRLAGEDFLSASTLLTHPKFDKLFHKGVPVGDERMLGPVEGLYRSPV